ncbi:MAG: type II toxin-antitoxin system RelE/ParE family toxin [Actinomycetota bacterium]|nr:type II toxin-antitoxin system RelE/ParE family toxin [Actinomycetota bacterium]
MAWEVEFTDEFGAWWNTLSEVEQDAIDAVVEILQEEGPGLRRPLVAPIEISRHSNMKELIPPKGNLRVLFIFDPRRMAILLIGGDKTGRWKQWYEHMVPIADRLYDEHLEELRREGELK